MASDHQLPLYLLFCSLATVFVCLLSVHSSIALVYPPTMQEMSDDESATSSVVFMDIVSVSLFDVSLPSSDDVMMASSTVDMAVMISPTASVDFSLTVSTFPSPSQELETSLDPLISSLDLSQQLDTFSLGALISPTPSQEFEISLDPLISSPAPSQQLDTLSLEALISPTPSQEFETSLDPLISSLAPSQQLNTFSLEALISPTPSQVFETSFSGLLISSSSQGFEIFSSPSQMVTIFPSPSQPFQTSLGFLISSPSQGFEIFSSPSQDFEMIPSPSQSFEASLGTLISSSLQGFEIFSSPFSQGLEMISPSQGFETSPGVLIFSPSPELEITSSPSQGFQAEFSTLFSYSLQEFESSSLEIPLTSSPFQLSTEEILTPSLSLEVETSTLLSNVPTSSIIPSSIMPLFTSSNVFLTSPTPTPTITEDVTLDLYLRFYSFFNISLVPMIAEEIDKIGDTVTVNICISVPSAPNTKNIRVECIVMIDPSAGSVDDLFITIIDRLVTEKLISFGTNSSSLRGFCDFDKTTNDSIGDYLWEEIEVGAMDTNSCSFGPPTDAAMAVRVCNLPRLWSQVMVNNCFTVVTQTFSNLNNSVYDQIENLSIEALLSFSSTLSSLSTNASTIVDQNSINVNVVIDVVRATSQFFSTNRSVDSQIIIAQIMSNFIQSFEVVETWPESVIQGTGSDLTLSLNELVNGLTLQTDVEEFGVTGNTISTRVVKQKTSKTVTFIAESTDISLSTSVMDGSVSIIGNTTRRGAIVLDTESDQDYFLTIYRNSSLFVSSNDTVLSVIMDLSTTTSLQSAPLNNSVYITFLLQDMDKSTSSGAVCVFWDRGLNQGLGDWSTLGCTTISNTKEYVSCQCNHLTAFAAILAPSGINRPTRPPPPPLLSKPTLSMSISFMSSIIPSSLVLTSPSVSPTTSESTMNTRLMIVSCVGIAVCMGLLFVTMITLLMFKPVRLKSSNVFHCQLCLALFCLLTVLIVGVNSTEHITGCIIVGVLLHYLILTSWTWFFAEVAHLLLKTYFISFKPSYKYLSVFSMFCWGIPILVVAVTIAIGSNDYISKTDGYCFISTFTLFLATVLIPVGLLLSLNIFMLIPILLSIGVYRQTNQRQGKSVYSNQAIVKEMIAIIGLMVLFIVSSGLIIIHFVGIVQQSFMQMIFASSCIILGMYLFCFFVLASNEARQGWKRIFKRISCKWLKIGRTYSYNVQNLNRGDGDVVGLRRAKPYEMSTVTILSSNSLDEVINDTTHRYEVDPRSTAGDAPTASSKYIVSRGIHVDTMSRHSSIIEPTAKTPDYYIEVMGEVENDKSSRVIHTAQVVDSDDFVVFTPIGLPVRENTATESPISTSDIVVIDNKFVSEDHTDSVDDDDGNDD